MQNKDNGKIIKLGARKLRVRTDLKVGLTNAECEARIQSCMDTWNKDYANCRVLVKKTDDCDQL